MEIAEKIKQIIKNEGYTQIAIAKKLDMNPKTFSAMLNGRKLLMVSAIPKICNVLGVTPNELFEYEANGEVQADSAIAS